MFRYLALHGTAMAESDDACAGNIQQEANVDLTRGLNSHHPGDLGFQELKQDGRNTVERRL
jgi:hypothetical protein